MRTFLPIRLSTTRLARSLTTLPSSTMLCSISESRISTSFMMAVNGPTYEWMIRARAPMITGPRTTDCSMTAPGSMMTLPSTRDSASTAPSTRRSIVSRISRFASSMSSSLPVSFHQPSTMCGRTSRPRSMRSWMASVISSSLRKLGLMRLTDSKIAGLNRYTPTSARSLFGSFGFSMSRTTRPFSSSATPNICGSGTCASRICAAGRSRWNSSTNGAMPLLSRLSPRYITNGSWPRNPSLMSTACARPRGASWAM